MFNGNGNGDGFYMPVAPAYGYGYGGGNGGFGFGGDGIWGGLLLGLLFGGLGGWGGFGGWGGGFGGMGGVFGMDAAMVAPYFTSMQTQNEVARGFDTQNLGQQINAVQGSIDSLRTENQLSNIQQAVASGFGDTQLGIAGINQNICQTGNNVVSAVSGAQNSITSQMYANQISDLERSFAAQTANTQGMNALQSQLAQCCCDNRAATADVKYTIATEACADRATSTANTQAILDKLCQLELDGVKREVEAKNDRILDLQNQLNLATMRESQTAQNAFIQQGLSNEVDALYNRLSSCPVPTTPVFGRTPIFTCNQNQGCGCNGNTFFN